MSLPAVPLARLYVRVLRQLGPERPLGRRLALANVLLAVAAFAEPALFGRMVDALYEATSALDAATEAKVKRAIDEVTRGRATFVIAHRLSTIRHATHILVFHEGRIVESGTFDELVTRDGRFAELAKTQFMVSA